MTHLEASEKPALSVIWKGAPLGDTGLPRTLFQGLRQARRKHGGSKIILQDQSSGPLSYNALVQSACALGAKIAKFTSPREKVGVLLPTSAAAVVVFFALQATGRVPAVLNYSAGASSLRRACALSGLKSVLTSRRFIKAAHLERVVSKLEPAYSFVYVEDLRRLIAPIDKIIAGLRSIFPILVPERSKSNDAAVILFTSGTTGAPKGVALSHANLLANIAQTRAHIPFNANWVFFNPMPIFHAFGLTGGTLLPILGGMKTVLYPSPLDHEKIPKKIQETGANVLISTDTFARFYARAADAEALAGLHYVVLGGEKVNETTRLLFSQKSSATLLEGYGATECGPTIAVNQPDDCRQGTVGKLLPGISARLDPVPGISVGARLFVRGPNVMLGYLDPKTQGTIIPFTDDWYDTGDLARIDKDGFVTVTGRVKRFAQIGAEMVSLEAVEGYALSLWPEGSHAAIARAGDGEAIVLVTDENKAERTDFAAWVRAHDVSRLAIPHRIVLVRKLPLLATGKPDYSAVRQIVRKKLGDAESLSHHTDKASGGSTDQPR